MIGLTPDFIVSGIPKHHTLHSMEMWNRAFQFNRHLGISCLDVFSEEVLKSLEKNIENYCMSKKSSQIFMGRNFLVLNFEFRCSQIALSNGELHKDLFGPIS